MRATANLIGIFTFMVLCFGSSLASATLSQQEIVSLQELEGKPADGAHDASFWGILRAPIRNQFGEELFDALITGLERSTNIEVSGDYIILMGHAACQRGESEGIIAINRNNGAMEIGIFKNGKIDYVSDDSVKSNIMIQWLERKKPVVKSYQYKNRKDKINSGSVRIVSLPDGTSEICITSFHRGNSGQIEFIKKVNSNGSVFYSEKSEYDDCYIKMLIDSKAIDVSQERGTCGAGMGVTFDGHYTLVK